jgi:hypothetical protein
MKLALKSISSTCTAYIVLQLQIIYLAPSLRLIGLDITTSADFLPRFFKPWAELRAETIYLLCKALSLRNLFFPRVLEIPRHLSVL